MNSSGAISIVNFSSIIIPSDPIRYERRTEVISVDGDDAHQNQSNQSNQYGDAIQNSDTTKRTKEDTSDENRPISSSEVVDELRARVVDPCLAAAQGRGWNTGQGHGQEQGYGQGQGQGWGTGLGTDRGQGPGSLSLSVLKGVLLLGPPGVGKTFAVRALQSVCRDVCTVS